MSRNFKIEIDGYYHLYNRGNNKRVIFETQSDYERFICLLYICNNVESVHMSNISFHRGSTLMESVFSLPTKPIVAIGAYCLMPNHFHLLIREITRDGTSLFMQKLSTAYTMYFNKKKDATGSLFQGRFKAESAEFDPYLKYLFSYIHLNPIKLIEPKWKETGIKNRIEAKKYLSTFSYSSYFDYLGKKRAIVKIIQQNNSTITLSK